MPISCTFFCFYRIVQLLLPGFIFILKLVLCHEQNVWILMDSIVIKNLYPLRITLMKYRPLQEKATTFGSWSTNYKSTSYKFPLGWRYAIVASIKFFTFNWTLSFDNIDWEFSLNQITWMWRNTWQVPRLCWQRRWVFILLPLWLEGKN